MPQLSPDICFSRIMCMMGHERCAGLVRGTQKRRPHRSNLVWFAGPP
jgi:hypothetical protein